MNHPHRLPRNALAVLIEAAKARSGKEWWEIELSLNLTKGSRQAWMNGKVSKPPLYGVATLANHLLITGDELMACVVDDKLPSWVPQAFIDRELSRETPKARPPKGSGRRGAKTE